MPKASEHRSSSINKRLLIGDSGTGKTTALESLVRAGFKLRIYDFDNLLDPLLTKVRRDCASAIDSIEFMQFRDSWKASPMGPVIQGQPKAFADSLRALDKWEDDTVPAAWGSEYVVVIDSLTTMSQAAWHWARGMQGASGIPEGVPTKGVDSRQVFYTAQRAIMNVIALLTGPSFNCNVLMIAHVKYLEHDGVTKGFPNSLGGAISPEIPSYFPSVSLMTKNGEKRIIRTRSTNMIDLKDPKAFDASFATELPAEGGLAELFK